jgi:hypothetical protein
VKILYILLCEDARENTDERLDVSGIFRRLYAPGFPAEHQATMVVGIEWDGDESGDVPFKLDMLDPGHSPLITASGHTSVPAAREADAPPPLSRLILPIERMVFPAPGRYEFELTIADERIAGAPLYLIEDREPG